MCPLHCRMMYDYGYYGLRTDGRTNSLGLKYGTSTRTSTGRMISRVPYSYGTRMSTIFEISSTSTRTSTRTVQIFVRVLIRVPYRIRRCRRTRRLSIRRVFAAVPRWSVFSRASVSDAGSQVRSIIARASTRRDALRPAHPVVPAAATVSTATSPGLRRTFCRIKKSIQDVEGAPTSLSLASKSHLLPRRVGSVLSASVC